MKHNVKPRIVEIHERLAELVRRAADLDLPQPGVAPRGPRHVGTIRRRMLAITVDLYDQLTDLGRVIDAQGSVGAMLSTIASLERRELRGVIDGLAELTNADVQTATEACRAARESVLRLGVGIEHELAGALGRPSGLPLVRQRYVARESERAGVRAELAEALARATAVDDAPVRTRRAAIGEAIALLSAALFHPAQPLLDLVERRAVRKLCTRAVAVLWAARDAVARSEAAVDDLLRDVSTFAAVFGHAPQPATSPFVRVAA